MEEKARPADLLIHICPSDQVLARDDIYDDLDMERNLSILIAVTTLYTESTSAVTAGQEFPSCKNNPLGSFPRRRFRDTQER